MTEGGGERSFDALSQVGVIELGGPLRLAYCGALLAQLGAAVVVVAAASDCAAPSDAIDAAARSALARAKQGAETVEEAASLLAGRRLVLVCDGRAPPGLADDLAATHGPVSEVRLDAHDAAGAPGLRGGGNALTACAVAAASHAIGHPDREPLPVPEEFVEHTCGLHAAVTAVLALLAGAPAAAAGGRAQALHSAVAMDECVRFYVGMNAKMYENYPRIWQREGRRSAGSAGPYPVGLFRCADGYVVIVSRSRADWHAIVAAMGSPAWARRPGWEDPIVVAERHADEADVLLGQWLDGLTCEQAVALGGKHGFAIARMLDPLEAVTTEQMRSRGFARSDGAVTVDARLPAIVTRAPAPGGRRLPRRQREPSTLLAGVRVLDLSWVWSGPAAAMMLAALGATVVKVESRLRPDGSRLRGRPVVNGVPVAGPELEVTPYFHQVNAGKLSVELDLGADEDRARVADLAAGADVLVENMRPGVLERHGLGYEALSDLNPSLVMLSMSLAGQQGPLRGAKGYASIMSALSGLESLVGYSPQDITGMLTVAVGDPNAATYGVLCVLGALLERERTGRGAWLDLSQLEAAACGLLGTLAAFAEHGPGVWAYGNWHARHAPHGSYPTRDGWVSLSVGDDEQWRGLLDALAIPADAALRNASLAGNAGRLRRREELNDGMARATASFERENLLERLSAAGVAAAPALELNDRSVAGFVAAPRHAMPMAHPYGGEEVLVTPPWDIDGAQPQFARRAPLLGEHTEEVLASGWPAA